MSDTKNPISSKTIFGIIIAWAPDIALLLERAEGTGLIPQEYAPLIRAVGLSLAAIGRWGAKIPLGFNFSFKW